MVELDYWHMPFPRNAEHLQAMQELLREQAKKKAGERWDACDAKKGDIVPPPPPTKDLLADAPPVETGATPLIAPGWMTFKWP